MLKKNNLLLLLLLSGCSVYKGNIDIPEEWHTPLIAEMQEETVSCFPWWEEFGDAVLNELIGYVCKSPDVQLAPCPLEAANKTAAEITRTYFELRGLQERLEILEKQITAQDTSTELNEGLSEVGFISTLHQNSNAGNLFVLFVQKSELQLTHEKALFHLTTLTGEDQYCLAQGTLPNLPCTLPVGTPCDLLQNHPGIINARKAYNISQNRIAFYNYKKQVLSSLMEVEGALATIRAEQAATTFFEYIKDLKAENYKLTQDLNTQGLKSDAELQATYLESLSAEDAYIQSKVKLLKGYVDLYEAQGVGFTDCSF